jgi:HK97 family phage major capsid protein
LATYIPRVGVEALMPEEYQREIIQSVAEMSIVMTLGKRAPNMSRAQRRIPVLSVLPTAYFTNPGPGDVGDLGWKKTSRMLWENKWLDVEELNVIIAIPESVLDDSEYNIWEEVKPMLLEAYGLKFDQAVFYGINKPAVWPVGLVTQCQTAGNYVVLNSSGGDIYDNILGENGVISKVELDGFMPNGHVGAMSMKSKLRGLRATDGVPIFKALNKDGVQGSSNYMLDGEPMYFPRNGCIVPERSLLISGDWSKLIYAIRKEITWKIMTEAVIQDQETGEIIYNLAQQNMVGLRSCMRLAWQVPNPINRLNADEDSRWPFAILIEEGS